MADFGVYIHVPFCSRRCDYCAFATWDDRHHLQVTYMEALATEIRRAVDQGLPPAHTVFVGGGTPSLVDPELLAGVLQLIPMERSDPRL
jgi:oxygen-independent coproporphyrinogen-3 oxidase